MSRRSKAEMSHRLSLIRAYTVGALQEAVVVERDAGRHYTARIIESIQDDLRRKLEGKP